MVKSLKFWTKVGSLTPHKFEKFKKCRQNFKQYHMINVNKKFKPNIMNNKEFRILEKMGSPPLKLKKKNKNFDWNLIGITRAYYTQNFSKIPSILKNLEFWTKVGSLTPLNFKNKKNLHRNWFSIIWGLYI